MADTEAMNSGQERLDISGCSESTEVGVEEDEFPLTQFPTPQGDISISYVPETPPPAEYPTQETPEKDQPENADPAIPNTEGFVESSLRDGIESEPQLPQQPEPELPQPEPEVRIENATEDHPVNTEVDMFNDSVDENKAETEVVMELDPQLELPTEPIEVDNLDENEPDVWLMTTQPMATDEPECDRVIPSAQKTEEPSPEKRPEPTRLKVPEYSLIEDFAKPKEQRTPPVPIIKSISTVAPKVQVPAKTLKQDSDDDMFEPSSSSQVTTDQKSPFKLFPPAPRQYYNKRVSKSFVGNPLGSPDPAESKPSDPLSAVRLLFGTENEEASQGEEVNGSTVEVPVRPPEEPKSRSRARKSTHVTRSDVSPEVVTLPPPAAEVPPPTDDKPKRRKKKEADPPQCSSVSSSTEQESLGSSQSEQKKPKETPAKRSQTPKRLPLALRASPRRPKEDIEKDDELSPKEVQPVPEEKNLPEKKSRRAPAQTVNGDTPNDTGRKRLTSSPSSVKRKQPAPRNDPPKSPKKAQTKEEKSEPLPARSGRKKIEVPEPVPEVGTRRGRSAGSKSESVKAPDDPQEEAKTPRRGKSSKASPQPTPTREETQSRTRRTKQIDPEPETPPKSNKRLKKEVKTSPKKSIPDRKRSQSQSTAPAKKSPDQKMTTSSKRKASSTDTPTFEPLPKRVIRPVVPFDEISTPFVPSPKRKVKSAQQNAKKVLPLKKRAVSMSMSTPKRNSSRNQREVKGEEHRVIFTRFDDPEIAATAVQLGCKIVDSPQHCTVLVTDRVRRTVKFLSCLSRGVNIVGPDWITENSGVKSLPDPSNYVLRDEEAEKKFAFNLSESIEKANEKKLFDGWTVYATPSVQPPVPDIKLIVESGGGKFLGRKPRSSWPEKTLVISCPEDEHLWKALTDEKTRITIYSTEILLCGVLQQKLDLKNHILCKK